MPSVLPKPNVQRQRGPKGLRTAAHPTHLPPAVWRTGHGCSGLFYDFVLCARLRLLPSSVLRYGKKRPFYTTSKLYIIRRPFRCPMVLGSLSLQAMRVSAETLYTLRDTIIPLVRSQGSPPRTNGLTRPPAMVTVPIYIGGVKCDYLCVYVSSHHFAPPPAPVKNYRTDPLKCIVNNHSLPPPRALHQEKNTRECII